MPRNSNFHQNFKLEITLDENFELGITLNYTLNYTLTQFKLSNKEATVSILFMCVCAEPLTPLIYCVYIRSHLLSPYLLCVH